MVKRQTLVHVVHIIIIMGELLFLAFGIFILNRGLQECENFNFDWRLDLYQPAAPQISVAIGQETISSLPSSDFLFGPDEDPNPNPSLKWVLSSRVMCATTETDVQGCKPSLNIADTRTITGPCASSEVDYFVDGTGQVKTIVRSVLYQHAVFFNSTSSGGIVAKSPCTAPLEAEVRNYGGASNRSGVVCCQFNIDHCMPSSEEIIPGAFLLAASDTFSEIQYPDGSKYLLDPLKQICSSVSCDSPQCLLCAESRSDDFIEGTIATVGGSLLCFGSVVFFILDLVFHKRKRDLKAAQITGSSHQNSL